MRNIIITGGGFANKGAQAMTLITVYELLKRYPDHAIYLYTEEKGLEGYAFERVGWSPLKFAYANHNVVERIKCQIANRAEYRRIKGIYSCTDLMLDISGYALGSNWSEHICMEYLHPFIYAKEFNIPLYIMPQTFGPFDFTPDSAARIDDRVLRTLPYAKIICAREENSVNYLVQRYGLSNVCLKQDIVLNNREIQYSKVLGNNYKNRKVIACDEKSVGIIPNSRNNALGSFEALNRLYRSIICKMLENGNTVYVLQHSTMDSDLCKTIKQMFADEDRVVLVEEEMNCWEYSDFVKQLKYLVASRFHSIIHAYKEGVPCIAIGWSEKYKELLKSMIQEQYFFDVRLEIDEDILMDRLDYLEKHHKKTAEAIRQQLQEIQTENVFDILPRCLV